MNTKKRIKSSKREHLSPSSTISSHIISETKLDYNEFTELPYWPLTSAVALSLGVSPKQIDWNMSVVPVFPYLDTSDHKLSSRFNRRFDSLMSAIRDNEISGKGTNVLNPDVKVNEFLQYVSNLNWKLPEELKSLQDARQKIQLSKWPWGNYTTPTLEILAETAHQWWSTYDIEQRETAPKQSDVISWLETNHKLSNQEAKAIAKILRHPSSPQGRRKK